MSIYEDILKARVDMTEWVIHFTRADGNWGTARDRLASILVDGCLRPGWAMRPKRQEDGPPLTVRTVYGPSPVVCFTEQPLWAFLEYLKARGERFISPYGIFVNKHDLYADGGRPVIYGLDSVSELGAGDDGYVAGQRTLTPEVLRPSEQYRVVTFAPNAEPNPIDWSHEREWRWPMGAPLRSPHLPMPDFPLAGTLVAAFGLSKGRAHAFVEFDDDIPWLIAEVARRRPPPSNGQSPQDRWMRFLNDVGVISLETVRRKLAGGELEYGRLETWPRDYAVETLGGTGPARAGALFK